MIVLAQIVVDGLRNVEATQSKGVALGFFADLSMESHKILMLYFRISNFTALVRFFEEISVIYANGFIFENERFSYIFDFLLSE